MSAAVPQPKVRKFPCDSCGADIRWDPGASAMTCPYCGAKKELAPAGGGVAEKSVDAALRAPRDLGWGAERKVMACRRCGAHTTLDPHVSASHCAFCGTAGVIEAPADMKMIRPEGLLPFAIPRETAIQSFRRWIGSLWFRPSDLKSKSALTKIQGAYIPFWTFDAATHSWWTADAGYYYYVTVQVNENGKMVTKQERRTRWEPASGTLDHFFDDVPVPASRGIEPNLCVSIEPFPTASLLQYEPSYLAGFLAEENAIDLPVALETAKDRMRSELQSLCSQQVPGDTQRNLNVTTQFSAVAYKNALLPIWIAAYQYGDKSYRFLVNGVTGKVAGSAPWSWVKIFFFVMAILAIVMIIFSLSSNGN